MNYQTIVNCVCVSHKSRNNNNSSLPHHFFRTRGGVVVGEFREDGLDFVRMTIFYILYVCVCVCV